MIINPSGLSLTEIENNFIDSMQSTSIKVFNNLNFSEDFNNSVRLS